MEKKIGLTRAELIKYGTLLAIVLSAFFALQFRVNNLNEENEDRKRENLELRRQLEDLRDQQTEAGKQISTINGKLDEIKTTVNSIADAMFNNQLNPGRNISR